MISLQISQLEKSFGRKTIFSNVSLSCRGESLGIAGANGSGKSTFLKCLGYLLRPTKGSIEWRIDERALDRDELHQILGYAAPYINLYDELSCRENLTFLSRVRHETKDEQRIDNWISKVGLPEVAEQPFGKLSTGQQQRLRLASALFHEPDILLLDEPGSNLDEEGRSLIANLAKEFQQPGKMLVIASNDSSELALCERVFSIEQETFV